MAKPLWYYPDGTYYDEDGFFCKELPESSTKMYTIYKELVLESLRQRRREDEKCREEGDGRCVG